VGFGAGSWRHAYSCVYYSPVPNDTYDPRKASQYRKVVVNDAKIVAVDTWLLALLLGALPGTVLARNVRRFIVRRRAARGDLPDLRLRPSRHARALPGVWIDPVPSGHAAYREPVI
jgi:hypothetical protein